VNSGAPEGSAVPTEPVKAMKV